MVGATLALIRFLSNVFLHLLPPTVYKVRPRPRDEIDGTTEAVLDTMEDLMTGGATFNDQDFQAKLIQCMDDTNPDMKRASDLAWNGMLTYYDMDGVEDDHWGDCLNIGHCVEYFEQNATKQELHDATIYEPCNYVSNLAYYHVSTVVCDHNAAGRFEMGADAVRALSEIHSHLAFGSAFWHGSHTRLGNVFDNLLIGVLSYISYQEAVRNLPTFSDPVVSDLSDTGRKYTGIEINDGLTNIFLTMDVTEWEDAIYELEIPDYYLRQVKS